MKNLIEELSRFVASSSQLAAYYQPAKRPTFKDEWKETLLEFLASTMDEIRLRHAGAACRQALRRFDVEDADYFRLAVLRRETSRDIAFPKQRDHSAHT